MAHLTIAQLAVLTVPRKVASCWGIFFSSKDRSLWIEVVRLLTKWLLPPFSVMIMGNGAEGQWGALFFVPGLALLSTPFLAMLGVRTAHERLSLRDLFLRAQSQKWQCNDEQSVICKFAFSPVPSLFARHWLAITDRVGWICICQLFVAASLRSPRPSGTRFAGPFHRNAHCRGHCQQCQPWLCIGRSHGVNRLPWNLPHCTPATLLLRPFLDDTNRHIYMFACCPVALQLYRH